MQGLLPAYSEEQGQSIIERLKAEGWTDEDIKGLMETAAMQAQITQGDADVAAAQARRNQAGPEGRYAGRAYVAAHPLEHLASAGNKALGAYEEGKARDRQQALRDTIMQRRMGALNKLGKSAQPQPAPGQAMNQAQANAKKLFPMGGFQWLKT